MSATEELYPFPDSSQVFLPMEFWPEFLASTTGTEFLAGGMGGMAGVMAGHPLDTVRIRLQQPRIVASTAPTTATGLIKHIVSTEGPMALFKGMATPLATIAFQVCKILVTFCFPPFVDGYVHNCQVFWKVEASDQAF